MRIESENFIVRDVEVTDKDKIYELEVSRPWMKGYMALKEKLVKITGADKDFFEDLWNSYLSSGTYWIAERKNGEFLGSVTIDDEGNQQASFYIQVMDDVNLGGFGEEMLDKILHEINREFLIEEFQIELWNDKDRAKQIYMEAGYDIESGENEICI